MPCGTDPFTGEQLGSCCLPLASAQFPTESVFNKCLNCTPLLGCIGVDCAGGENAGPPLSASSIWFIGLAGQEGWLTTEAPDVTWHADKTCAELRAERGGDDGPCGISPACCKQDHTAFFLQNNRATNCDPSQGTIEWGCVHAQPHICDRGYWVARDFSSSLTGSHGCRIKMHPALLGPRSPGGGIRVEPGGFPTAPVPFLDCYRSEPNPSNTMCECSFNTPPFISQDLRDLGFEHCLSQPQDTRTWEEKCGVGPPDDEFDCFTLGMPLIIDEDGFAAFDAGNKRVDSDAEGCAHVLADLYVDSGGFAHSLACTKFDDQGNATAIAIGDFHQEQCAATYSPYRWNTTFEC